MEGNHILKNRIKRTLAVSLSLMLSVGMLAGCSGNKTPEESVKKEENKVVEGVYRKNDGSFYMDEYKRIEPKPKNVQDGKRSIKITYMPLENPAVVADVFDRTQVAVDDKLYRLEKPSELRELKKIQIKVFKIDGYKVSFEKEIVADDFTSSAEPVVLDNKPYLIASDNSIYPIEEDKLGEPIKVEALDFSIPKVSPDQTWAVTSNSGAFKFFKVDKDEFKDAKDVEPKAEAINGIEKPDNYQGDIDQVYELKDGGYLLVSQFFGQLTYYDKDFKALSRIEIDDDLGGHFPNLQSIFVIDGKVYLTAVDKNDAESKLLQEKLKEAKDEKIKVNAQDFNIYELLFFKVDGLM